MNYYKRHLGDYARKAGHLTALEHGAYTLLLDSYYELEQAPTMLEAIQVSRAQTAEERAAVANVLEEFFWLDATTNTYIQNRAEKELRRKGRIPMPERLRRSSGAAWEAIRNAVFRRDGHKCVYCNSTSGPLECDHVVPLSRGGSNQTSNLATACQSCNRRKHNKTNPEWCA